MTKSKHEESEAVKELKAQLREQRRQEKLNARVGIAKLVLNELEDKYEESKRIFFAVNGARRVLKSV